MVQFNSWDKFHKLIKLINQFVYLKNSSLLNIILQKLSNQFIYLKNSSLLNIILQQINLKKSIELVRVFQFMGHIS